ncbi:MAG: hypothetical protein R2932_55455 [Caldilineaceae bacterium]
MGSPGGGLFLRKERREAPGGGKIAGVGTISTQKGPLRRVLGQAAPAQGRLLLVDAVVGAWYARLTTSYHERRRRSVALGAPALQLDLVPALQVVGGRGHLDLEIGVDEAIALCLAATVVTDNARDDALNVGAQLQIKRKCGGLGIGEGRQLVVAMLVDKDPSTSSGQALAPRAWLALGPATVGKERPSPHIARR